MNRIETSPTEFSQALQKSPIECDSQGNWFHENAFMRVVRRIFHLEDGVLAGVGQAFNQCLDRLEKIPVQFNADRNEWQVPNSQEYLDTAEIVKQVLERSSSQKVKKELNALKYRIVALRYRLEKDTIEEANKETVQKIERIANEWKSSQFIFDYKQLNLREQEFIKSACFHKLFAERVLEDTTLREEFLRWIIQDHNSPEVFIQYPGLQEKLVDSTLSPRTGFQGEKHLRIQKKENLKIVTLPFEGKKVSILDEEKEVHFSGNLTLTMKEIFAVFKARMKEIGELEYFQDGIRHFNPKRIYDFVDLEKEKWWEILPVLKEISVDEAQLRYDQPCDGKQWVIEVKASRDNSDFQVIGTHAYLEVAIPINDKYRIYTFGKFTETFPQKWYEYLDVFTNTFPAIVSYPDENIIYTNRQQIGYSALATPKEGGAFMASIKRNILDGKKGNLVFMVQNENCSKWALKKAQHYLDTKRMPDLFGMDFFDIEFSGFIGLLFSILKKMPYFLRWLIVTAVVIILGAWRGKEIKTKKKQKIRWISLLNDMPWTKGNQFIHPGNLFQRKEALLRNNAEINGVNLGTVQK
ncbi:MAG: hypothetical protein K940chlam7_02107 [Chlamydiae bacterium]|nr:hypothetical protein [Chlamydiota bacterium]